MGDPMRPNGRTVDHLLQNRAAGSRQCIEEPCPDTFPRPADKEIVEGFPSPADLRRIDPAAARLQRMNDVAGHPTIVDTGPCARIGRQGRLQLRKLLIVEPEDPDRYPQTPVLEFESDSN